MKKLLKGLGVEVELFKPGFTDDESEDHDDSENESEEDGDSSHSSAEEKSEKAESD